MAPKAQRQFVSVSVAAVRLRRSYQVTLNLVMRGQLRGHQDDRRRWFVDAKDVQRMEAAMEKAK